MYNILFCLTKASFCNIIVACKVYLQYGRCDNLKHTDCLDNIKTEVQENIGKKVILRSDKGRRRIVTNEGVIVDAYPNIFIVRVNNKFDVERTVSYSYSDILTSTVEVKFC